MNKFNIYHKYIFFITLGIESFLFILGCGNKHEIPNGIYATPSVKDLGVITDKEIISGKFKIVNTNQYPVNIRNVKLSCGCADVHLSKEIIPPDGFIDVELTVELKGKYGHNMFEALISTDDTNNPILQLVLIANIATKEIDGAVNLDLGFMGPGDHINQSFDILPGKINSVSVTEVSHDDLLTTDNISVSAEALLDQEVKLNVTGVAPVQNGEFALRVNLKANGADWQEAHVCLRGRVRPDISLPSVVFIGFIEKGKTEKKDVSFINSKDVFSRISIDKMVIAHQLPENLNVKLINESTPHLEISLTHSDKSDTFSQDIEIDFILSNGKKCQLMTNIAARFL
jgi:LEA14-like dessication related protein